MGHIYAGQIVEKRLGEYNDAKTDTKEPILNIIVGVAKQLVGDISVTVKKTVVLFKELAVKTDTDFKEGDYILFNEVLRNPRIITTEKGTTFETVDINLQKIGSVQKLTKKAYDDNRDGLDALMLTDADLEFTDADRVKITKTVSKEDTDLDTVFSA